MGGGGLRLWKKLTLQLLLGTEFRYLGKSEQTFRYNGCLTVMNGIRDGQQLAKMKTGFSDFVGPENTFCISDLEAYPLIIFIFLAPPSVKQIGLITQKFCWFQCQQKECQKALIINLQ